MKNLWLLLAALALALALWSSARTRPTSRGPGISDSQTEEIPLKGAVGSERRNPNGDPALIKPKPLVPEAGDPPVHGALLHGLVSAAPASQPSFLGGEAVVYPADLLAGRTSLLPGQETFHRWCNRAPPAASPHTTRAFIAGTPFEIPVSSPGSYWIYARTTSSLNGLLLGRGDTSRDFGFSIHCAPGLTIECGDLNAAGIMGLSLEFLDRGSFGTTVRDLDIRSHDIQRIEGPFLLPLSLSLKFVDGSTESLEVQGERVRIALQSVPRRAAVIDVRDADHGAPIPGARVTLVVGRAASAPGGRRRSIARSDADGRAKVELRVPSDFSTHTPIFLSVDAPGYQGVKLESMLSGLLAESPKRIPLLPEGRPGGQLLEPLDTLEADLSRYTIGLWSRVGNQTHGIIRKDGRFTIAPTSMTSGDRSRSKGPRGISKPGFLALVIDQEQGIGAFPCSWDRLRQGTEVFTLDRPVECGLGGELRIVDEDGRPIPEATVVLQPQTDEENFFLNQRHWLVHRADQRGLVRLPRLRSTNWVLELRHPGFTPKRLEGRDLHQTKEVELRRLQETQISLIWPPSVEATATEITLHAFSEPKHRASLLIHPGKPSHVALAPGRSYRYYFNLPRTLVRPSPHNPLFLSSEQSEMVITLVAPRTIKPRLTGAASNDVAGLLCVVDSKGRARSTVWPHHSIPSERSNATWQVPGCSFSLMAYGRGCRPKTVTLNPVKGEETAISLSTGFLVRFRANPDTPVSASARCREMTTPLPQWHAARALEPFHGEYQVKSLGGGRHEVGPFAPGRYDLTLLIGANRFERTLDIAQDVDLGAIEN